MSPASCSWTCSTCPSNTRPGPPARTERAGQQTDRRFSRSGPGRHRGAHRSSVVPFVEELFFRGLLLQSLVRMCQGSRPGAGPGASQPSSTGILFGLAHAEPVQLAGLALFGTALSVIAYRTGRLGTCIFAHAGIQRVRDHLDRASRAGFVHLSVRRRLPPLGRSGRARWGDAAVQPGAALATLVAPVDGDRRGPDRHAPVASGHQFDD